MMPLFVGIVAFLKGEVGRAAVQRQHRHRSLCYSRCAFQSERPRRLQLRFRRKAFGRENQPAFAKACFSSSSVAMNIRVVMSDGFAFSSVAVRNGCRLTKSGKPVFARKWREGDGRSRENRSSRAAA